MHFFVPVYEIQKWFKWGLLHRLILQGIEMSNDEHCALQKK